MSAGGCTERGYWHTPNPPPGHGQYGRGRRRAPSTPRRVRDTAGSVRDSRIRPAYGSFCQVKVAGAHQYAQVYRCDVTCETKRDREALAACFPEPKPDYYDVAPRAGDFPG